VCPGVVLSFRATQLAILELWKDEIPKRGDFKIISAAPFPGVQDTFEFIARVATRGKGDFKIELPKGTDLKNITEDNFVFTIIRKSTGDSIKVRLRKELFSERFFQLRKKKIEGKVTPEEIKEFMAIKQESKNTFMNLPVDKLFESNKKSQ
jgi:formylmethanofuran dehydrogenase subunit E